MKIRKILSILILSIAVLSLSSCWLIVGAAGGGAAVAYVQGTYTENLDGNVKTLYNAALKAVQDNNNYVITTTKEPISGSEASIEGSTKSDATSFSIDIKKLTDKSSSISVKFGTFGDQKASEALVAQIKQNAK